MNRAFRWMVLPLLILLAGALGQAPCVNDVYAATYVFKFAHAQPDTHPRHKSMISFKEQLESASNSS
jgi:TRAP-type C4-dicarboxylate transport system substrate-binding protein